MKNFLLLMAMAISFVACEKAGADISVTEKHEVTFLLAGNFVTPTITRGTLTTTDGQAMSDLWAMDYVDGALVQIVHQTSADEDFGSPTLSLSIGNHNLYFVCAGGSDATVSEALHKVTWARPRDAFWKHIEKAVTSNTASTQAVALDRATVRLTVKIEDAIPTGTSRISIQPQTWYYGIDWLTGNGTDAKNQAFNIAIPESYAGRTNTQVGIYGIGQVNEFTTDVTLAAWDGNDNTMATVNITGAPMQKNRSTNYTGRLFSAGTALALGLNDEWDAPYNGNW